MQPLNNASRCTDTGGFLEQLPNGTSMYFKGPTLQLILGLGGEPLGIAHANIQILPSQ